MDLFAFQIIIFKPCNLYFYLRNYDNYECTRPKRFRGKIPITQSYIYICCSSLMNQCFLYISIKVAMRLKIFMDTLYLYSRLVILYYFLINRSLQNNITYINQKFIDKMIYYISSHIIYLLIYLL